MGYREERELARIRYELRERLLSQCTEGSGEVLARFRAVASTGGPSRELDSEYERWRVRFAAMAVAA